MALGLSEPTLWLHRCPRAQKLGTKEARAPCSPLQLTVDVLLNFLVQNFASQTRRRCHFVVLRLCFIEPTSRSR